MDTIYKYFLREMAWLESAGRDFAKANPGLDTFLHGGGVGDPHVDRILEGAAFLAARLDKRLDDSLLRVAEGILGLTYPELMEPQPALAIVQFSSKKSLKGYEVVQPDAQLVASGRRADAWQVRLRVADRVAVGNFQIGKVEQAETTYVDRTALKITISSRNGKPLADKEPMAAELPILLFWNDFAHTCTVRRCIANMPVSPRFTTVTAESGQEAEIEHTPGLRVIKPLEYHPMLNAGKRAFPGFRMMREFFALPQRFMQIAVVGLDRCEELKKAGALTIELTLPMAPRDLPPFNARNFLLFTSAVCNEWNGSSRPIIYDGTRETYQLEADHTGGAEILRVLGVRMLQRGEESFAKVDEFDYYNRDKPSYSTGTESYQLSATQSTVRWHIDLNNLAEPGRQVVVTADLALANGDAHEVLGARTSFSNYEGVPEELLVNTISPSTDFAPALEAEGQYWQLVDMVASNLSSMTDPLRLQKFLLHLNRTDNKVMAGAIRGIRDVDLRMKTTTIQQQPVKTASMSIDIDRKEFLNHGFIEMFFEAFYVFLNEFVPLNCLLQLEIRDVDTKEIVCRYVDSFANKADRLRMQPGIKEWQKETIG